MFSQGHQVLPKWDIKEPYSCRCGVVVSLHVVMLMRMVLVYVLNLIHSVVVLTS